MHYYVDESGNTGLELFDKNQPVLYYGVLCAQANLDVIAKPLLEEIRGELGVKRIHANELGVGKLTPIAHKIARFSKKNDLRFSLLRVVKPDHAIISFFDQVFDAGLNKAVRWQDYWTPLRYILLFKVARLFDEELAKYAWKTRRQVNPAHCAKMLTALCNKLSENIEKLPDARSRELISGALKWASANPHEIGYGVGNHDTALQISPNLVGFQNVLMLVAKQSAARSKKVKKITVDRQTEFNKAQGELSDIYQKLRGHNMELGPGMPTFDFSTMPETSPTFTPGDESSGLELVDVSLWIAKRLKEEKPISRELHELLLTQAKRGLADEVSLAGMEKRWRFITQLPEPDRPIPSELQKILDENENKRKAEVDKLG